MTILLVGITLIVLNVFLFAAAQTADEERNTIRYAYTQTVVRDEAGYLILYYETDRISFHNIPRIHEIFDYSIAFGNATVVMTDIDENPHQWINNPVSERFEGNDVRSTTALGDIVDGEPIPAISFTHDGYFLSEGDVLTVLWTLVRPSPT